MATLEMYGYTIKDGKRPSALRKISDIPEYAQYVKKNSFLKGAVVTDYDITPAKLYGNGEIKVTEIFFGREEEGKLVSLLVEDRGDVNNVLYFIKALQEGTCDPRVPSKGGDTFRQYRLGTTDVVEAVGGVFTEELYASRVLTKKRYGKEDLGVWDLGTKLTIKGKDVRVIVGEARCSSEKLGSEQTADTKIKDFIALKAKEGISVEQGRSGLFKDVDGAWCTYILTENDKKVRIIRAVVAFK